MCLKKPITNNIADIEPIPSNAAQQPNHKLYRTVSNSFSMPLLPLLKKYELISF